MATYVLRRLLTSIPLLLGISVFVFAVIHLLPGGPVGAYGRAAQPDQIEALRHKLGLDQPLPVQYMSWLSRWVRGDWGESLAWGSGEPVRKIITERVGNTALLVSLSICLALCVGVLTGIIAALRQYSLFDNVLTVLSFLGFCIPVYWLGLIMIYVFDVRLQWLPGGGMYTLGAPPSLMDRIRHLVLPVSAAATYGAAVYTRYLRSSMLEVINLDYIRTARAKGLRERAVIVGHALRNALIPLVTIVSMDLPWIFGGSVLVETIFSWPGMGRKFWQAALDHDYPVLMSWIMLLSIAVVLCNLLADIAYAILDPRIRYEARTE